MATYLEMQPYMCEPTATAKKRWQRDAETEMALQAMEEAEANNGPTVAADGWACVASVHWDIWCLSIFLGYIKKDVKK